MPSEIPNATPWLHVRPTSRRDRRDGLDDWIAAFAAVIAEAAAAAAAAGTVLVPELGR